MASTGDNLQLGIADEVVGLREFARLVDVDLKTIQKAIAKGRIPEDAVVKTTNGNKLWRKKALAAWETTRIPGKNAGSAEIKSDSGGESGSSGKIEAVSEGEQPDSSSMTKDDWFLVQAEENAKLTKAKRELAELELAEEEGQLHRTEDLVKVWGDAIMGCRQRILAIPVKAAPAIALKFGLSDVATIEGILRELCDEALSELARGDVLRAGDEQSE